MKRVKNVAVITPTLLIILLVAISLGGISFGEASGAGSISGAVQDPSGSGIAYYPGILVSAYNEDGSLAATNTSDGSGNFSVAGLADGNYKVYLSDPSYALAPVYMDLMNDWASARIFTVAGGGDNGNNPAYMNYGPTITNILPTGTITTSSPTISADLYADMANDAGIDVYSAVVSLDGTPLTGCTTSGPVTATHISCPATGLPAAPHTISITVSDNAGHAPSFNIGLFNIIAGPDTTPPATTMSPTAWQKDDFNVTLTCTDETGGSGCQETSYQLDGAAAQYGTSIPINTVGDHEIIYHSVDIAGNVEADKTGHAMLDKTAPSVSNVNPTGSVSGASQTIEADLADAGGSEINAATAAIALDGGAALTGCTTSATHISCPATGLAVGAHSIAVSVNDNAGNAGAGSGSFSVAPAARDYYWPWYDNVSMRNWVLMANPAGSGHTLNFGLSVGGASQNLAAFALPGQPTGQVPEGMAMTPIIDNLMGGPVKVSSNTGDKAIVSQRSLMGNSLEEVLGTEESKLSDHFWWTWYDQVSPGMNNWILVANPSATETVRVEIRIQGTRVQNVLDPAKPDYNQFYFDIEPGNNIMSTFPDIIGGPVEVKAFLKDGLWPQDARNVIASQRVLSNSGAAFNEVPGIPDAELSSNYLWTWYDQQSAGAMDWVLVANPGDTPVTYEIKIAGAVMPTTPGNPGTIPAHGKVTPTFPGIMNGPVEVTASANVIASQRVIFGPSFEEVPGYPQSALASDYHWTWYDQVSAGSTNWVLVSNPGDTTVTYQIKIAGTVMPTSAGNPGTIPAHGKVTPTFPGTMNGPVEVISTGGNVMVSQRVLWNGYFNEVLGTVLN